MTSCPATAVQPSTMLSPVHPATDRASRYSLVLTRYLRELVCTARSAWSIVGTETLRAVRTFSSAVAPQFEAASMTTFAWMQDEM